MLRLSVIVLGEYRFGLASSRDGEPLGQLLDDLQAVVKVLPIDELIIQPYADIRQQLRRGAKILPQNDVWIAALGPQHCLPIVSHDQHFDLVDGVRRIGW
ncbi:MAG: PilT protein domain protein [Chthoniobacteraceae bacterium]|nr:PilT protein domain protein [Chthoniobacteraceae bacterium]